MMRARRLLPALAVAALLPATMLAQSAPVGSTTGYGGVEVRGLSFQSGLGIKSVTQIAVPIGAVWQAGSRLAFDFGGRYATVTRKDEAGGSASVSGLTDIQARGIYQVVPDVAVLSVSVNLPTGKAKLTPAQLPVANVIASDMIPFPVANFASGFNLTTGLALAVPVSGWAVGLAGSYRANGSFTPIADTGAAGQSYKAGGEVRVRLGADRIIGQSRVSLGLTYSSFGEDDFGSSPLFQSGKRLISQASWSFPIGNLGLAVYAWDLYRAAGSVVTTQTSTEKRNVLTLGTMASVQLGRSVLRPQIEFRNYTTGLCAGRVSDQLCAGGKLVSLGARLQLPVGERYTLLPLLRLDAGNVVNPNTGQAVGYTGWDFGVTIRANM
jgi:hypothetical protein